MVVVVVMFVGQSVEIEEEVGGGTERVGVTAGDSRGRRV